jgi:hypothetical protein
MFILLLFSDHAMCSLIARTLWGASTALAILVTMAMDLFVTVCSLTSSPFTISCVTLNSYFTFCPSDVNECDDPSLASYCAENAECCNLPGHFVCKCKSGFTGNATQQCVDIDECAVPDACGRGAECENKIGSHLCRCPLGYTGDANSECWDIDECKDNPCAVGATCQNLPGSFECSCPSGYRGQPSASGGCSDIDECDEAQKSNVTTCGLNSNCVNTLGSYFCQCPTGFTGNPRTQCSDVNECPEACGRNSICKNLPGSFQCKCLEGYEGDAYSSNGCHDVNECAAGACGVNAVCQNTIGSFECACASGFTGDPHNACQDINECLLHVCGPGALCNNMLGSYECKCPDKYIARGSPDLGCERSAVDVSCFKHTDCTGNAVCEQGICRCNRGYVPNGANCVDLNECIESKNNSESIICGKNGTCINTDGAYRCDCADGFEHTIPGDLASRCQDVNECMTETYPCGANANCINEFGSYKCTCRDGFVGDAKTGCKSPCEQINCGPHAKCRVADDGQPVCACDLGYQLNTISDFNSSQVSCIDIDECDSTFGPSGLCGQGAICTNKDGGHHCYCPPGFTGDPFRQCSDLDECNFKYGPFGRCGVNALCENTVGGFRCNCPLGFEGDARVRCFDVDECDRRFGANGRCGFGAICTNSPGTYTCRCPPGTTGDARYKCIPLQSCQSDDQCFGHARCVQSQCRCSAPFIGENCKHPCELMNCGDHAQCELDSREQAVCVCSSGFTGSADSLIGCTDVDECTPLTAKSSTVNSNGSHNLTNICGKNASCRNLPGTYDCVCPIGSTVVSTGGCSFTNGVSIICKDDSSCGRNEQCLRLTSGEKYCACRFGYQRDNLNSVCRDINECVESSSPVCGTNAYCSNTEGAYVCSCPAGYTGNPNSICYPDVLRCSGDHDCPGSLRCLSGDSNSAKQCRCDDLHVREGDYCVFTAHNCSSSNPACPSNQRCELDGQSDIGFCICPAGFTLEANGNCRDIDECVELPDFDLCGFHTRCKNTIGSFECECEPGYQGNPKTECTRKYQNCELDSQCASNYQCRAGFCECLPPFVSENNACHNPCRFHQCGRNAECILSASGLPSCRCSTGCTGDPNRGCQDINECFEFLPNDPNGPCSVGSVCINTFGSFRCECRAGLNGDPYKSGCTANLLSNGSIAKTSACAGDDSLCSQDAKCDPQTGLCLDACHGFECPQNAVCVAANHLPSCLCAPGYRPVKSRHLSFTENCVSDCDHISCAGNAECIIDQDSKAVCHCPVGTTGNPWAGGDGCKTAHNCTASHRCPDAMVCSAHAQCVYPCGDKFCGPNAICNSLSQQCECPPHYRGDPFMLCAPPIPYAPVCEPNCGRNSHCSYELPFNKCVCNSGFSGNPYQKCERLTRCDRTKCGRAAHCVEQADSSVRCVCDAGYYGNPYIGCDDINECLQGQVCGHGASCVNLFGSYRCICSPGTVGNPLYACHPPTSSHANEMHDLLETTNKTLPQNEQIGKPRPASDDTVTDRENFDLDDDRCIGGCKSSLVCYRGACGSRNACKQPRDCDDESTCTLVNERVGTQCVDPCDTVQCGPNAACIVKEHIPSCHCNVSYVGNPDDLVFGCAPGDTAPRQPSICDTDEDCDSGFVCRSLSLSPTLPERKFKVSFILFFYDIKTIINKFFSN